MRLAALLAAAVAAQAAPAANAPEIWRGARAGMTIEQVQGLFPQGRPTGSATPGETGAVPAWAIDEQVYGRDGVATQGNLSAARTLATQLSGYYGKPKACVDLDRRGLARMDCRWSAGKLDVGLSYLDYGGANPTLDVSVRLQPAKPPQTGAVFKTKGRKL